MTRVLWIEDEPERNELLEHLLKKNYTLRQVKDYKMGLEEIKTKKYDIIIFDMLLSSVYEKSKKRLNGNHLIQKVVPRYISLEKVIILTILGKKNVVKKMKELQIHIGKGQIFSKIGLDHDRLIQKIKKITFSKKESNNHG